MAKRKKAGIANMGVKTCGPCPSWCNWTILAVGVLYLLGDLGIFTVFSDIFSWWTVAFLLVGLKKVCK